jgi:hypothetical protein
MTSRLKNLKQRDLALISIAVTLFGSLTVTGLIKLGVDRIRPDEGKTPESVAFRHLPDTARVWSFGVSRPLEPAEEARLLETVDAFLEGWKAHGHPLAAARDWRYGRFLLVAVNDRVVPPSGCSIDALIRSLKKLEKELGVEMVGGAPVWYREGGPDGEIRRVSRPSFKAAAERGRVTALTTVFDLSITRLGELREGKWELPAGKSWHGRFLV